MEMNTKINSQIDVDRRDFLKKLGCGVIVVFTIGTPLKGTDRKSVLDGFNAYLRVKENGRVDVFTGKIEMGQGAYTSLAQVVAEELEVPIKNIDMVMGDTELCPYDAGTWGSMTTPYHDPILRAAAAEARQAFIEIAAEKLELPISRLRVKNGTVYDKNNRNNQINYAVLTQGRKVIRTVAKPKLKTAVEFTIVGKPVRRLDALMKVTGKARYSGDILLPGMLHAVIKRPPAHDAKLISIDTSGIENIPGLVTIRDGDLFAVLHESPDVAQTAVVKIKAEWDVPEPRTNDTSIFDYLKNSDPDVDEFEHGGDMEVGRNMSSIVVNEEYYDGYKAHASIETHTATAEYKNDKLTMWVSSQTPFGTREQVAEALGLPLEKVHLKQNFIGGGFGGKIYNQQAVEAAKIARAANVPIQLMWSRKEEFLYDRFRPAAVVKIKSGIDNSGRITFWDYNVFYAGSRGASLFYDIPNYRGIASSRNGVHPLLTGAWRAPGNSTNTFARETQIDIMANKIDMDPVEFRLKNLKNNRVIRPLKAVADRFGWTPNMKFPRGKGWGVALGEDVNVYVAMMAEVEINDQTGEVTVKRVVCGQDMGQVVNPQGTMLQVEGGITMGLGYALSEHIQFDGGAVKSSNFSNYEIARFSITPKIETVFIDDMDSPPLGGGEPSIICVGAVVANAIYNACGARMYKMPFTPESVFSGIQKASM